MDDGGSPSGSTGASERADLTRLRVDLQEGFQNDTVVVEVDGSEVLCKGGLSTNWSVGLADAVETQVPRGVVNVKVSLPARGLSEMIALQVTQPTYLYVSIVGGKIEARPSDVATQYL
jgi:hypothetical protein